MGVSNCKKGRRAAGFFKLCLGIAVSLSLVLGGIALTPGPVQATGITPAGPVTYNLPVCIPWQQQFTISPTCPPGITFYWLVGSTPAWVNLDTSTGLLTACPDAASAGNQPFFPGLVYRDEPLSFLHRLCNRQCYPQLISESTAMCNHHQPDILPGGLGEFSICHDLECDRWSWTVYLECRGFTAGTVRDGRRQRDYFRYPGAGQLRYLYCHSYCYRCRYLPQLLPCYQPSLHTYR